MRLIHISDLHLDSPLNKLAVGSDRRTERNFELLDTFEHALQYARQQQVTGILLAGDLFDKNSPTRTMLNAVKDKFHRYADLQFYYLKGNHERDSLTENLEELPSNLHLFSQNGWTEYALDAEGRICLYGLELNEENCANAVESLELNRDHFNIVMLHGQAENLQTTKHDAEGIPLGAYRNRGIDYMALGHVHKHMVEALDHRGTWAYSGCLEGRGFDEPGEHGLVLLEIDEVTLQYTWSFVPMQKRRVWVEAIDCSDCVTTGHIEDLLEAHIQSLGISDRDMVRFLLQGALVPEADLNMELLEHASADRFYTFCVKDETSVRIDPNQYAHDVSLRGEFVRGVLARTDLSEEDRNEVLRMGLRLMRGESV